MTNSSSSKANNTEKALRQWCDQRLAELQLTGSLECTALSGDASFRKYYRLRSVESTYIAVHAPPSTEKNVEFVAIAGLLEEAGLVVPKVLAVDYDEGYLLQTDLGDRLLLPELNAQTVDHWYGQALDVLGKLQQMPTNRLTPYSRAQMREDLQRFPEWFVEGLLQHATSNEDAALFDAFCDQLLHTALEQPQCFTHYDFQSRNLMLTAQNDVALIDFQDSLLAPMTYDLVSLLRDCYIKWPLEETQQRALHFAHQAKHTKILNNNVSDATFLRWFDYMSLQRHVRVLGTFARLYLRDDKPGYLGDIPLVCDYVAEVSAQYSELAEFSDWFSATLLPITKRQDWFKAT